MQIQLNFTKYQLCNVFQCADYIILQGVQKNSLVWYTHALINIL